MVSFCLQLCIPELWLLKGAKSPRCFSPNNTKLHALRAGKAGIGLGLSGSTSPSFATQTGRAKNTAVAGQKRETVEVSGGGAAAALNAATTAAALAEVGI